MNHFPVAVPALESFITCPVCGHDDCEARDPRKWCPEFDEFGLRPDNWRDLNKAIEEGG